MPSYTKNTNNIYLLLLQNSHPRFKEIIGPPDLFPTGLIESINYPG